MATTQSKDAVQNVLSIMYIVLKHRHLGTDNISIPAQGSKIIKSRRKKAVIKGVLIAETKTISYINTVTPNISEG